MKLLLTLLALIATLSLVFSQKVNYDVYALRYANVASPFPISALVLDGPEDQNMNAVFMIWLIKESNGRNILVDAGFILPIEESNHYQFKDYERPDSTLAKVGLRPEEISDIIITHPHWDHMDGIDLFPNAQLWIQKDDYNYFTGSAWQANGRHGGFNKRDVIKIIKANLDGKLTLIDGDDKEIIPGIKVYTGSRHTFNSQYVLVESGDNKIIIASDNMYTYYNLELLKSAPLGATFDTEGYVNGMKRMKTLSSDIRFIIPGHDASLFSRFPIVSEGVVQIK
ncbi:MAG: N-acyl homoserine lactonase family protein [Bacteroidota bacterium]